MAQTTSFLSHPGDTRDIDEFRVKLLSHVGMLCGSHRASALLSAGAQASRDLAHSL